MPDALPLVTTATRAAEPPPRVSPTADVDDTASLGVGTVIWHLAQIREHAQLGRFCTVGRGAYVGTGVHIGDNVKIQNQALVYEPAKLADGVFIGPAAVLTNDRHPRAITRSGILKNAQDWQPVGVEIARGASVGARVVCVAPLRIGRWAMIAAGAVVTVDVPDFGLSAGVPARRIGWVGPVGVRLREDGIRNDARIWRCPATGEQFLETDDGLREIDT